MAENKEMPRQLAILTSVSPSTLVGEIIERGKDYVALMSYYAGAMMEVETKFRVLNMEFNAQFARNPIETIKTRIKSPASIYEKMKRLGLPPTVENIETALSDVAGVRIICSFLDDIYQLADMLMRQDDVRVLRVKDYIKNPKESGYRSLHLIVEVPIFLSSGKRPMRVEVQLRTIAMDFWASLEHKLRYKKDIPQEKLQEIARELSLCADIVSRTDEQMLSIRKRIEDAPA